MRVIVAGSRSFRDYHLLKETLDELAAELGKKKLIVLSGHAEGADRLAEEWCRHRIGQVCEVYHPDYQKYGKVAPLVRNTEMVNAADALVAFWDGVSTGTKDVIDKARREGLKVKVIRFKE